MHRSDPGAPSSNGHGTRSMLELVPLRERLEDDPLYQQALHHMQAAEWPQAEATLAELSQRYPESAHARELLAESRLKAQVSLLRPRVRVDGPPVMSDRRVRLLLAANVLFYLFFIGFYAITQWQRNGAINAEVTAQQALLRQAEVAVGERNWTRALASYKDFLTRVPGEPVVLEAVARLEENIALDRRYDTVVALLADKKWDQAIVELEDMTSRKPGYRDTEQLLTTARARSQLVRLFKEAETRFAASEWSAAIASYEAMRAVDLQYEQDTVKKNLLTAYSRQAAQLAASAGENLEPLKQAVVLLDRGLSLKPLDAQMMNDRLLAASTYQGAGFYEQGAYVEAIGALQAVVDIRPDYARGRALSILYESYIAAGDIVLSRDSNRATAYFELAADVAGQWKPSAALRTFESKVKLAQSIAVDRAQLKTALPIYREAILALASPTGACSGAGWQAFSCVESSGSASVVSPEAAAEIVKVEASGDVDATLTLFRRTIDVARVNLKTVRYTLREGESVALVAYRHGSTVDLILRASNIASAAKARAGQELVVPQYK